MVDGMEVFLHVVAFLFLVYLLIYATYLFLSVSLGAYRLYKQDKMVQIKNELKHDYYFPVSVLVPAYNEEVTILDSIRSLLTLEYKLYEIVVVDDGSQDGTTDVVVQAFHMQEVSRPIRIAVPCQPLEHIYETRVNGINLTLIRKKNGGKGDALNMGINASVFPYFVCIDADSMLQKNSLERIVQPTMADDNVVAVGGMVRVARQVELDHSRGPVYRFVWRMLSSMQAMEYDRSFLAARILLDNFNGNLIISGAFGLFKKDVVMAVGGYDTNTLGEDMELVMKLHTFCRSNGIPYAIRYEPSAICWSQAPGSFRDLGKQRRRWHLGLFQCLKKYRHIFLNRQFGAVGTVSYLYYLLYELFSPYIELFGVAVTILAGVLGYLNIPFMIEFYLLYALYGAVLTVTAFFQQVYTRETGLTARDVVRTVALCLIENILFHFFLAYVRATSFIGYRKHRLQWGRINREKNSAVKVPERET